MIQVRTIAIDLDDTTLDSAAGTIEAQTNAALTTLADEGRRPLSVQLIALGLTHTSYGDAHRDYTHHERGAVVLITHDEKPNERRQANERPHPLRPPKRGKLSVVP